MLSIRFSVAWGGGDVVAYHQHGEVGRVARHAEDGRLQIFLVAGQVDEGDDFGGARADLDPI